MCEDENNTVIILTNQILNRWKDYFSTICNLDTDDSLSNCRIRLTLCDNQEDGEVPPPSYMRYVQ